MAPTVHLLYNHKYSNPEIMLMLHMPIDSFKLQELNKDRESHSDPFKNIKVPHCQSRIFLTIQLLAIMLQCNWLFIICP